MIVFFSEICLGLGSLSHGHVAVVSVGVAAGFFADLSADL